jgi:hypothetical protein
VFLTKPLIVCDGESRSVAPFVKDEKTQAERGIRCPIMKTCSVPEPSAVVKYDPVDIVKVE